MALQRFFVAVFGGGKMEGEFYPRPVLWEGEYQYHPSLGLSVFFLSFRENIAEKHKGLTRTMLGLDRQIT